MSYDATLADRDRKLPAAKRRRCVACDARAATPGSDVCARCFIDS